MTPLQTLSPFSRAIFAFLALMLCLAGIAGVIMPLWKKRYLFSALALVLLVPVYFMWQVIFDIALHCRLGTAVSAVGATLGNLAWGWWVGAFLLLTAAILFLLGYSVRYEKDHVTLGSIKKYLDQLPCGVAVWADNGRVLFANMCINDLCVAITHEQLLNGNLFCDAVDGKLLAIDDKMWRFTARELTVGKRRLHEMIASDITSEYAKTQALEADKAELDRLNRELKAYNQNIDETVRRQEVLQAKANIHDEMNRLMLSTMSVDSVDAAAMDRIFALWEQNALLLCMQADDTANKKALSRVEDLAAALNIRLVWQDELPAVLDEEQRKLLFSAAQEAVANAAKHAAATQMTIAFAATRTALTCRFTNDGAMPAAPVRFSGGLCNLAQLATKQGATVTVEAESAFTLSLVFPLRNRPNG